MNYSTRIKIAAFVSVLLHAGGFALLQRTYKPAEYIPMVSPEPIVLDLQPEPQPAAQPEPPRQLVNVTVPAENTPPPTDRIAEENAEAMDLALRDDNTRSPALAQDEFDVVPRPAAPATPPAPASPPVTPDTAEDKKEDAREETVEDDRLEEVKPMPEELLAPEASKPPAPKKSEAPIKIAQAQPTLPQRPEAGKSRERGGVSKQGATNFDAIQNEIAPYLKQVRQRVERQWNEMLYTRYSGTSPVKAVIDCAINAQGELVSVTVVGTENDRLYSALCRDSVQRAGPFGPFTFEVPDMYRGKNLEIRWTFSFL